MTTANIVKGGIILVLEGDILIMKSNKIVKKAHLGR